MTALFWALIAIGPAATVAAFALGRWERRQARPPCRCGHSYGEHTHYRRGSDCARAACGCTAYRPPAAGTAHPPARPVSPQAGPRQPGPVCTLCRPPHWGLCTCPAPCCHPHCQGAWVQALSRLDRDALAVLRKLGSEAAIVTCRDCGTTHPIDSEQVRPTEDGWACVPDCARSST